MPLHSSVDPILVGTKYVCFQNPNNLPPGGRGSIKATREYRKTLNDRWLSSASVKPLFPSKGKENKPIHPRPLKSNPYAPSTPLSSNNPNRVVPNPVAAPPSASLSIVKKPLTKQFNLDLELLRPHLDFYQNKSIITHYLGNGVAFPELKEWWKIRFHNKIKRQSKPGDTSKFSAQLAALDLRIVHITADGNCFFRAVADQLEGNEEEHAKYRHMVVEYIMKNRESYEPFVEDDVPFEKYCESMLEDGTWAGHMELQAASLVTQTNICIHRLISPRWNIHNFDRVGTHTLHLSYHDGEHYNSVRLKNDDGSGPAKPIVIEEDDSVKEKYKSSSTSGKRVYDQESVKLVLSGTGCADITRVHDVLQQVHGDTDAAIEFLIAEQTSTVEDEVKSCAEIDANGGDEDLLIGSPPNINNASERNSINIQSSLSEAEKDKHEGAKETCRYQKTSRNNPCSCGSKKKHKACCKVERHKFDAKSTSQEALTNKVRKMKLRGSKSEIQSSQSCATAAMGPPDLGALYI